jgi:hypothetical protein
MAKPVRSKLNLLERNARGAFNKSENQKEKKRQNPIRRNLEGGFGAFSVSSARGFLCGRSALKYKRENRNFLYQTFLFRFLGFCLCVAEGRTAPAPHSKFFGALFFCGLSLRWPANGAAKPTPLPSVLS